MRLALISDVHGNLEALTAVLADIDAQNPDAIHSLGDFIDYGPDSEAVTQLMIKRDIPNIMGNHDYAMLDRASIENFAPHAADSLHITAKLISEQTRRYIRSLPRVRILENLRLVHGLPPDSLHEYIIYHNSTTLGYIFQSYPEAVAFVGHTHLLGLYCYDGEQVRIEELPKGVTQLDRARRYILNIGSVGQPRDMNRDAKYALFDTDAWQIEIRFIPYDAETTAQKIIRRGYPRFNATRLL